MIAMAPNYQAGKDFVGLQALVQGGTITDGSHAAQSAGLLGRAGAGRQQRSRRALRVLSGRSASISSQFQQAGLNKSITVMSTSTVDEHRRAALRDAAIGMRCRAPSKFDFPNKANQKFVAAFEKNYNRIPRGTRRRV